MTALSATSSPQAAKRAIRLPAIMEGARVGKNLDDNLRFAFLIHDVSRLRRVVVDRALKPQGITRSQWWVLAFLSRRDGMTLSALAADLDLTKVAIGKFIHRMETLGFVERRPEAQDARVKRVYLTKAGMKRVNNIRENVDKVEQDILRAVSNDELSYTSSVLLKIKATLLELTVDAGDDAQSFPENRIKEFVG